MSGDTAILDGALADRDSWRADGRCSVDRTLQLVGTRSAMLLLREAFYGTHRFDEFARRVGITEAVTSVRLRELTDAGLLRREPYRDPGQRTRYEYRLTDMGRDLAPALLALMQWGDRYLAGPGGPPLQLRHAGCDAPVSVRVGCEQGHDVPLRELVVRAAPRPAAAP